MLGMKTYNKSYIDACRARVDAGLHAYLKQPGKAPSQKMPHDFQFNFGIRFQRCQIEFAIV
jgi:hypothetical protein